MKQTLLFFFFVLSISVFSQVANKPYDLWTCDSDHNGFEVFDLTVLNDQVLGGQNSSEYLVTYHLSDYDVHNDKSLDGFYGANIDDLPVTIYAKVTSVDTGNYDFTSFELYFVGFSDSGGGLDVIKCDDNESDGITAFSTYDLGVDNSSTVHKTREDAIKGIKPLTLPYHNTTPHRDMVYLRQENSYGCYKITYLHLEVRSNPEIQKPTPFLLCDDNADGFSEFDLMEKNDEILDGSQATITYHLTSSDAASFSYNGKKLPELYTNTTAYTQTVYARATFSSTGCYKITSLDLIVQDCRDLDNDNIINSYEDFNKNNNLDDDDTDLDTIPDYLDDDDDGDGVLTKDEDYNNNGTPLDDDTNANNIPDYLDVSVALETEEFEVVNFKLFPNPAKNHFYLQLNEQVNSVSVEVAIVDLQGKEIIKIEKNNTGKSIKLDISQLKRGLYFVKVIDGSKTLVGKLMVQ
ncbi:T9SS type A sorting domain-containing protein [Tamlana crocina]